MGADDYDECDEWWYWDDCLAMEWRDATECDDTPTEWGWYYWGADSEFWIDGDDYYTNWCTYDTWY